MSTGPRSAAIPAKVASTASRSATSSGGRAGVDAGSASARRPRLRAARVGGPRWSPDSPADRGPGRWPARCRSIPPVMTAWRPATLLHAGNVRAVAFARRRFAGGSKSRVSRGRRWRGARRSGRRPSRARPGGPRRCAARRWAPARVGEVVVEELDRVGQHVDAVLGGRAASGIRSWNCGSSARVFGVLTGAMVVLIASAKSTHSAVVRVLKIDGELVAQLEVAPGVVGVLRARMGLEQVGAADAVAEVLPELPLGGHEQDVAVGGLVDLVADAVLHPGGARAPGARSRRSCCPVTSSSGRS